MNSKLIFGLGRRNKKKIKDNGAAESNQSALKQTIENANTPEKIESSETETPATSNQISKPGHGRLPHSACYNTIEHQLLIANLKADDLCPMQCGGKLYFLNPGVIVRVQKQNLASVHKYWIDKLRYTTCGHLISADILKHVGKEKYDAAFKGILALQKYYVRFRFTVRHISIAARSSITCFYAMATN